jgi:putative colanic acid biosysnthesis UDP-glucose lipid carrier transferase
MKTHEKQLLMISLLVDLIVLQSTLVFINWFRFEVHFLTLNQSLIYSAITNCSWIMAFFAFSRRNYYIREGFKCRFRKKCQRIIVYLFISSILVLIFLPKYHALQFFAEHTILFIIGKIGAHFMIYTGLKYFRRLGINTVRVAIITHGKTANLIRRIVDCNPSLGYKFLGFIEKDYSINHGDVLGSVDNLNKLIKEYQIQTIFTIHNAANNTVNQYLKTVCDKNGVQLRFIAENNRLYGTILKSETVEGLEDIKVHEIPLDDLGARLIKRLFDVLFSLGVIVLIFTWLFPIIAILIKLSSKGPVFFTQKRTGIHNSTFTCYKFRSMRMNNLSDTKQATADDNRITPIGRFMRNNYIDELPQFFNILFGQMSVVGPRPHMLKHTDQYSELIENYLIRHYVKPGTTGWAQQNGYSGETRELWKMEKRVEYDIYYIENWSLFWDIKIILRTIFGVKNQKTAPAYPAYQIQMSFEEVGS